MLEGKIFELERKVDQTVEEYKSSPAFLNDVVMTPGLLAERIFRDPVVVEPFFTSLLGTQTGKDMVRTYGRWVFILGK